MADSLDSSIDPKDKLVADLKVVVNDAEELLAATAQQTGEKIAALRERMQDNLRDARLRLADAEAAVRAKTRAVAKAPTTTCTRTRGVPSALPLVWGSSSAC